jgi:hypothetical protein
VYFLRTFALMSLCIGLIFQVSAQASAMPQSETMLASDCAEMKHHASQEEGHHGAGEDSGSACQQMSIDCLLSMNAVAPVWLGTDQGISLENFIGEDVAYLAGSEPQFGSRVSDPDSPPPRF